MVYIKSMVEDKTYIILTNIKYIIVGMVLLIAGMIMKEDYSNIKYPIMIIGIVILLLTIIRIIIRTSKSEKYLQRLNQIKKNGKQVTGTVVEVKTKHYLRLWDLIAMDATVYEPFGNYLYSATIEYEDPETSKSIKVKTPFDVIYLENAIGCECELYVLENDVYLEKMDESSNNEELADEIKKNGKKIAATITEGCISSRGNTICINYKDPKTKQEKKHTHEINFNPKRLESDKCTLYKYENEYYLDDFKLGEKTGYKTHDNIKIKDYRTETFTPEDRKKQKVVVAIILIIVLVLYIFYILNI